MPRVDLHTHSEASPDGSLKLQDYKKMLESGLDIIAITDHDTITFALAVKAQLGDNIVIGEEISTSEGEIVGLYLHEAIEPGLSAVETVRAIHKQGGLVYIPHPFETVRKGIPLSVLDSIVDHVDIVEVRNGRAIFQNYSAQASAWAQRCVKAGAASSDAHGWHGWGKTYSTIASTPTRDSLVDLLQQSTTKLKTDTVGLWGIMYPKLNRLRGRI